MKSSFTLLLAGVATALRHPHAKHDEKGDYPVIYPCPDCPDGVGPPPVTITKQYQVVPTCHPDSYGKSAKCSSYAYVHTIIPDCHGKDYTVTKTDQPVTVCYTKSTLTHTSTDSADSKPTPHEWHELYEKTCEVPYDHLGPIGLPGYDGSGLCGKKCKGKHGVEYQPMKIKECYDGKCSTYDHTYTHGAPGPQVTSYDSPGTYTIPSYDMTVSKETAVAADAHTHIPAHQPFEYGGVVTEVAHPTTIVAPYAVYKKHGHHTKTHIKYVTKVCLSAGKYTVVKPHTTSWDHDKDFAWPTAHVYKPGVYHHDHEVVTITKGGQHHTFRYKHDKNNNDWKHGDHGSHGGKGNHGNHGDDDDDDDHHHHHHHHKPTHTRPHHPDPSSDYSEPAEEYGKPDAGYSHHAAIIKRKDTPAEATWDSRPAKKRVILV